MTDTTKTRAASEQKLFVVTFNGVSELVSAPTAAIAKAYGKEKLEVGVRIASLDDIKATPDLNAVPVLTAKVKAVAAEPAAPVAEGEVAAEEVAADPEAASTSRRRS